MKIEKMEGFITQAEVDTYITRQNIKRYFCDRSVETVGSEASLVITVVEESSDSPIMSGPGKLWPFHMPPKDDPVQEKVMELILSKAKKLFTVLLYLDRLSLLEAFFVIDLYDDVFPIQETDKRLLGIGTLEDRREICKAQWIVPPVLDPHNHFHFPQNFISPFLDEEKIGSGTFGNVYKVKPATGHLIASPSVSVSV